ncbi:MAG: hypothetical protein IJX39_04235 [Clostridia bacterium]|nr:hypothetical protein [Clostridia bacterium]
MKSTIMQLWNGELAPWSERELKHKEVSQLAQYIEGHCDSLASGLDKTGKETLEKLRNDYDELARVESEDAFLKGFSLGVRLMTEALGDE